MLSSYLPDYKDRTDSVPKRRHIKLRRRGITQKKAYTSNVNKSSVDGREHLQPPPFGLVYGPAFTAFYVLLTVFLCC